MLQSDKVKVYASLTREVLITYPPLMDPENYRDIVIRGRVEGTGPLDLSIEPYVSTTNVTSYEFSFKPAPPGGEGGARDGHHE